jgi:hypothetical protein
MSSLLDSKVAEQASLVGGIETSGASARVSDPAVLTPSEVNAVSETSKISGGRRRRRSSKKAKKSKARKSSKRRSSRSYRRPRFIL